MRLLRDNPAGLTTEALREACGADLDSLRSTHGTLYTDMSSGSFSSAVTRMLKPLERNRNGLWRLHDLTGNDHAGDGDDGSDSEEQSDPKEEVEALAEADKANDRPAKPVSDANQFQAIARDYLDRAGEASFSEIGEAIRSKLGNLVNSEKLRYRFMPSDQLARNVGRALQGYGLKRPNCVRVSPLKAKRRALSESSEPPAKAQSIGALLCVCCA